MCRVTNQPPDQAVQSHIQPGLECLQGWGIHSLLGQPVNFKLKWAVSCCLFWCALFSGLPHYLSFSPMLALLKISSFLSPSPFCKKFLLNKGVPFKKSLFNITELPSLWGLWCCFQFRLTPALFLQRKWLRARIVTSLCGTICYGLWMWFLAQLLPPSPLPPCYSAHTEN